MALEKRTKARHEKAEKSMKETRLPIREKSKIHISEASFVKGKGGAIKTSDKVEETVAKDPSGKDINGLEQHIKNLLCPSTLHFFNTLYDPYRENTDAIRKIDADAISTNKAPSKIVRQITESDLKTQIVLE